MTTFYAISCTTDLSVDLIIENNLYIREPTKKSQKKWSQLFISIRIGKSLPLSKVIKERFQEREEIWF